MISPAMTRPKGTSMPGADERHRRLARRQSATPWHGARSPLLRPGPPVPAATETRAIPIEPRPLHRPERQETHSHPARRSGSLNTRAPR
jgi:hypothetical protein